MVPSSFFLFDYASVVVFLIYCFLHVLNLHFVMLQGFQHNYKNAFTSHAELNVHRHPRGPRAGKWGCGEREWGDWFQLCRNMSGAAQYACADFLSLKQKFPLAANCDCDLIPKVFCTTCGGTAHFHELIPHREPRARWWLVSDAFDVFNFLSLPLHIKDVLTDISASDLWRVLKKPEWY